LVAAVVAVAGAEEVVVGVDTAAGVVGAVNRPRAYVPARITARPSTTATMSNGLFDRAGAATGAAENDGTGPPGAIEGLLDHGDCAAYGAGGCGACGGPPGG
jgi:hypothetical protein